MTAIRRADLQRRFANWDKSIRLLLLAGPDESASRELAQLAARTLADPADPMAITDIAADELKSDPGKLADEAASVSMFGGARLIRVAGAGESAQEAVRLLLALLGRDAEIVDVEDSSAAIAQAKADGRLPFGKAPVLELDDGRLLPESNAILTWLGEGTRFAPTDAYLRAQMLAWMFWEQNQHEGTVAVRGALLAIPDGTYRNELEVEAFDDADHEDPMLVTVLLTDVHRHGRCGVVVQSRA